MLKGQNIICFGSENWEYLGFQQKVMRLLSRHNRILYVNALGIRKVSFQLSQFTHYFRRFLRIFKREQGNSEDVAVCSAWIIPLVYSATIAKLNRILIRMQFSRLLRKHNFNDYILWIGTPSAAFLLKEFKPRLLVYNPVDRYYAFPFVDGAKLRNYEKQIAINSDVIVCTSEAIRNDLLPYNDYIFTVTHGVDFKHFNSALSANSVPEDIKDISKPIIGYFGALYHRVNYDLLYKIAIRYPTASLVLIGYKAWDLNQLEKLHNVHILGFKDFNVLPLYLNHFTVCIIPYHVNNLTEGVDPIKLREYLCLGKPVVSVDLPEVKKLNDLIYLSENDEDYVAMVGKAIKEKNKALIEKRIDEARQSDWSLKIEEISKVIIAPFSRRSGGHRT